MKNTKAVWIIGICLLALGASSTLMGKTDPDENNTPAVLMTNERLYQILKRIDSNVEGKTGFWKFKVDKTTVTLITDQKADRMRIIIPIVKAEALSPEILFRLCRRILTQPWTRVMPLPGKCYGAPSFIPCQR